MGKSSISSTYLLPLMDIDLVVEGEHSQSGNPYNRSANDVVNVERNLCFGCTVFVIDHVLADVVKVLRLRCILWFMGCRVNRFVTDERLMYTQTSARRECSSRMERHCSGLLM